MPSRDGGKGNGLLVIPDLRDRIEKFEDPGRRCQAVLDLEVHLVQISNGIIEQKEGGHEREEGTRGQFSPDDAVASDPDDEGHAHPSDDLHQGMGEGPDSHPFEDRSEKFIVLLGETPFLIFLHIERLDDPISGDGLVEEGGERAHPLLGSFG